LVDVTQIALDLDFFQGNRLSFKF